MSGIQSEKLADKAVKQICDFLVPTPSSPAIYKEELGKIIQSALYHAVAAARKQAIEELTYKK